MIQERIITQCREQDCPSCVSLVIPCEALQLVKKKAQSRLVHANTYCPVELVHKSAKLRVSPHFSLFADDDEQLRGEARDMTDGDHVATGSTLTG